MPKKDTAMGKQLSAQKKKTTADKEYDRNRRKENYRAELKKPLGGEWAKKNPETKAKKDKEYAKAKAAVPPKRKEAKGTGGRSGKGK